MSTGPVVKLLSSDLESGNTERGKKKKESNIVSSREGTVNC